MTVVVGVDGSPPLRTALRLAAQEAHWRQVPLVAVSAYEPPFGLSAGGYPIGALLHRRGRTSHGGVGAARRGQ